MVSGCRICVSVIVVVSQDHYLGRCTVYLGNSAHQLVSTCLSVFSLSMCHLSIYHFSVDLVGWPIRLPALLSPALDPLPFLSSGTVFGCRAAALASSSTLAVGQSFRQLSPRGARPKRDQ